MENLLSSSQIGTEVQKKLKTIINIAKRNPKTAMALLLSPMYSKT